MRSHVTQVETDIKVGAHVQLGRRTLITGKSRSGKSTIVNGLEAAGSGRVSDVAGRTTLARDAELITLARGDSVFARVGLSDGGQCLWMLERGHRGRRTGPEIAFPLRDVREALLGEPDKVRKWILRNGGALDWDDVVALVPEALQRRLAALPWDAATAPDPAERLAQAIDEAKRRTREENAKAKNKPASPAGPPPSDAEVKAAEERIAAFTTAARFEGAARRLGEIRQQIPLLRKKIETGQTSVTLLRRELRAIPAIRLPTDTMRAALVVVEAFAATQETSCAICGGKVDPEVFAGRARRARAAIDATLKAEQARSDLETRAASEESAIAIPQRELNSLVEEEKRLAAIAGGEAPTGDPEEAHRALADLHDRRAGWKAVRDAETACLQAAQDAFAWSQLAEALSLALGKLVERARFGFEARVQPFLPADGWVFGIDLYNDGRDVARVGLREGDQLRSALSGVEWATVTAALALATAPAEGPVVIAPEERAFDPDTLAAVLEAFGKTADSAQVIVTSPIAPSFIPDSWTVVEAGSGPPAAKPLSQAHAISLVPPPTPTTPRPLALVRRSPGRPRRDGTPAQPRTANFAPAPLPPAPEPELDPVPPPGDEAPAAAEGGIRELADLFDN